MQRRHFLAGLSGAFLPRSARAAEAEISVLLGEPIGAVGPYLQGHFIEHLGGVVYDGVWVGPTSKIPNQGGVRTALVEAAAPGTDGNALAGRLLADSYDWKDGIGPMSFRPTRPNFWSDHGRLRQVRHSNPARNDPNQFGTHEFMRFCPLIQAEPYFAANLRSLPARDSYDWIDFCNAPAGSSTLADERATGGDKQPSEFRKFTSWAPRYEKPVSFMPAGSDGADLRRTRELFTRMAEKGPRILDRIWGWALHYYCGTTGKGDSVDYTVEDAYELLNRADRMDSLIREHWQVMGEIDRDHRVKPVVDEWGAWHRDGTAAAPHHLFGSVQKMHDALVAGLTLDTFHRHADKLAMANVAQLINCIQTLFLAHEDQFCVTPTYHVFDMYESHHNGEAVRTHFAAPQLLYTAGAQSESLVHGPRRKEARGVVLAADDIHADNSFEQPSAVRPRELAVQAAAPGLRLTLPPMSVVKLEVLLDQFKTQGSSL